MAELAPQCEVRSLVCVECTDAADSHRLLSLACLLVYEDIAGGAGVVVHVRMPESFGHKLGQDWIVVQSEQYIE